MNAGVGIDGEIAADAMKALHTNHVDVVLLEPRGAAALPSRAPRWHSRAGAGSRSRHPARGDGAFALLRLLAPARQDRERRTTAQTAGTGRPMSPGELDPKILRRHLASLQTALAQLCGHAGRPATLLQTDLDELWARSRLAATSGRRPATLAARDPSVPTVVAYPPSTMSAAQRGQLVIENGGRQDFAATPLQGHGS